MYAPPPCPAGGCYCRARGRWARLCAAELRCATIPVSCVSRAGLWMRACARCDGCDRAHARESDTRDDGLWTIAGGLGGREVCGPRSVGSRLVVTLAKSPQESHKVKRNAHRLGRRHGERRASYYPASSACCLRLTIHALEIGTTEPVHSTLRSDKTAERFVLGAVRTLLTALFHAPEVPGWLDRNGHLVAAW